MRNTHDIKQLTRDLRYTPSPVADQRILEAAQTVLAQNLSTNTVATRPLWRVVMESPITKYAVAAILLIAAILFAQHITSTGYEEQLRIVDSNQTDRRESVYAQAIEQCYQEQNLPALIKWLSSDELEAQVLAAQYLGEIGDADSLVALQILAETVEWPELKAACERAIEKIKTRMETTRVMPEAPNDVNQVTLPCTEPNIAVEEPVSQSDRLAIIKVVDNDTKKGLEGVTFEMVSGRNPGVIKPDGSRVGQYLFVLTTREQPAIRVVAKKTGYVPLEIFDLLSSEEPDTHTLTISMTKGVTVRGRITTKAGKPLAGVTVKPNLPGHSIYQGQRYGLWRLHYQTDAQGYWHSQEMPDDVHKVYVNVEHSKYIVFSGRDTTMDELKRGKHVTVLWPGYTVRGRVQDHEGQPVAGAELMPRSYYDKRYLQKTDAQGRFVISKLPPYAFPLMVQATGFAPAYRYLGMPADVNDIVFTLEPERPVTVRVLDWELRPVQGAHVKIQHWFDQERNTWHQNLQVSHETDESGLAIVSGVPNTNYRYRVHKKGYLDSIEVFMQGNEEMSEIVLEPQGQLQGRVLDARTQQSIERFRLKEGSASEEDRDPWWGQSPKHCQQGTFKVHFSRRYLAIRLAAEGYQTLESERFKNDGTTQEHVFYLQPGEQRMRRSKVVLPSGGPAVRTKVVVADEEHTVQFMGRHYLARMNNELTQTTADANGFFSLPQRDDKHDLLLLHKEGYARVSGETLEPNETVVLTPWGRVEGMYEGSLQTRPGVSLSQLNMDERNHWVAYDCDAVFDGNGTFVFREVPAGYLQVERVFSAQGKTESMSDQMVIVTSGKTTYITVRGGERQVLGTVVPKAAYDVSLAQARLATHIDLSGLDLPYIELPEDFLCKNEKGRESFVNNMKATQVMQEYMEAIQELAAKHKEYKTEVSAEGALCFDHVIPGLYDFYVELKPEGEACLYQAQRLAIEIPESGSSGTPVVLEPVTLDMERQAQVGEPAPNFSLEDSEGTWHELQDYRGQWVLLEVGGCLTDMNYVETILPTLLEIEDARAEVNDLTILSLNLWMDMYNLEVLFHRFVEHFDIPWQILFAKVDLMSSQQQLLNQYPHKFVLINPEGKVALTADTEDASQLLDKIKASIHPYLPQ